MRLLLTAITCEKGTRQTNLQAHLALVENAIRAGCDVVAFPEFSLTGSVDPWRAPDDAVSLDDWAVTALAAATAGHDIAAVFGVAERAGDEFFITQAVARDGQLAGYQRKRHLGEDEAAYGAGTDALVFDVGAYRLGIVICAEAGVDRTWNQTRAAGADVVLMCSAPGLYGRRTNEAEWRSGFEWWDGHGVVEARLNARRLHVWVAMATQAGSAARDEDFPGIAALVSPDGEIVERLPDWHPGTLIVEVP